MCHRIVINILNYKTMYIVSIQIILLWEAIIADGHCPRRFWRQNCSLHGVYANLSWRQTAPCVDLMPCAWATDTRDDVQPIQIIVKYYHYMYIGRCDTN